MSSLSLVKIFTYGNHNVCTNKATSKANPHHVAKGQELSNLHHSKNRNRMPLGLGCTRIKQLAMQKS